MSDSPTPETDAARLCGYNYFSGALVPVERKCYEKDPEGDVVFYEVAEKLERERDEARRELDLVSDKLCKSESAYLKNEEIIDGLKNEIEHTETFFREKLSRAADDVNEAKRERDEARRERDEAISKLKFAQNELFTILRFQEDEKREHRNLLERLSFFQNRFESMRAERDQAMSDLEELREEQKEEA